MKNYSHSLVRPLLQLMLNLGKGELPPLKIKPLSELGLLTEDIITQGVERTPSMAWSAALTSDMDRIGEYLDDPTNIKRVETIEEHASAFAAQIENASATLKNDVGGFVQQLSDQITEEYAGIMRREKTEDLLEDTQVSESDYQFIKWNGLGTVANRDTIIDDTAQLTGIRPELSRVGFDKALRSMSRPGFGTIQLPADSEASLLEDLIKMFCNDQYGVPEERVKRFHKAILKETAYRNIVSENTRLLRDNRKIAENLMFLIDRAKDFGVMFYRASKVLNKYMDGPTEKKASDNIEKLRESTAILSYCLLVYKEVHFKDTLILNTNTLNSPVYERMVQRGRSIEKVHNYLKVFYREKQVPLAGISLEAIDDDQVDKRLDETITSIRMNAKRITTLQMNKAFKRVIHRTAGKLRDDNLYECGDNPHKATEFTKKCEAGLRFFNGDLSKVQDHLYGAILTCFYSNTLVETLYSYLGDASVALAKLDSTNITDEDVLAAEMEAFIQPLAEFLVKKLSVPETH